jgi:cytoskeletal protein CcmA (bactofilin family)
MSLFNRKPPVPVNPEHAGVINLQEHKIHTQIAPDAVFQGDLLLPESGLLCQGQLIGSAQVATMVVVVEGASIEGDIKAPVVVCYGSIKGNVEANRVEVFSNASLSGSVTYGEIDIQKGANVSGTLTKRQESVAEVARFPEHRLAASG